MENDTLIRTPEEENVITPEEYKKAAAEKGYYYVRLSCGLIRVRPPSLIAYMRLFRKLGISTDKDTLKKIAEGASWEDVGLSGEAMEERQEELLEFMGTSITVDPRVYPSPSPGEKRDPGRLYWDDLLDDDQLALIKAYSLLQEVVNRKFRPGEPGGVGSGDNSEGIRTPSE